MTDNVDSDGFYEDKSYQDREQHNLEKLELEQTKLRDRDNASWRDRYSTTEKQESEHYYKKIVNARLKIAPISGENIKDYIKRLKIYQRIAHDTNWETHVDNGKRTWYTHKKPNSCFMCQDTQFIGVCIQVMEILADANPKFTF